MLWCRSLGSLLSRLVLLALLAPPPGLASCRLVDGLACGQEPVCRVDEQAAAKPAGCCAADVAEQGGVCGAAVAPCERAGDESRPCLCLRAQFPAPVERRSRLRQVPGRVIPAPGVALPEPGTWGSPSAEQPEHRPDPDEHTAGSSPRSPPDN